MATRTPTTEFITAGREIIKFVWTGLLNGDSGSPIEFANYPDRSIQVSGTFGAGGSVLMEGSNNGEVSYSTLNKTTDGTAMTIISASLVGVLELAAQIRPRVTAGDGTTNLTVTMIARRSA